MSKGKIIVIGANQGGLAFAIFAAKAGFDVQVFESKQKDDVAYDWYDDMMVSTFEDVGLPRPPKVLKKISDTVTFIPPAKKTSLTLRDSGGETDLPIERKPLNEWLAELAAESGVKIFYGVKARRAAVNKGKVLGVFFGNNQKYIPSDLVVDCAGAASCVRSSLPKCMHIPQKVSPSDTFFVRRVFFRKPDDAPYPEQPKRIYLKHLNQRGISWCFLSNDGKAADVLVGRLNELSDETFNEAIEDLKSENDIIGDTVVKGGEQLIIPVRHAISRMTADGYALLGDSAYMTIPIIGSGMANSITAAKILSDVISEPDGDAFGAANLYRYQRTYMNKVGADNSAVDLLKNWLLNSKDGDVDFLLEKNVINESMIAATSGDMDNIPGNEIVKSAFNGMKNPPLFAKLVELLVNVKRQSTIASSMPEKYDEADFEKWQEKYEKLFVK